MNIYLKDSTQLWVKFRHFRNKLKTAIRRAREIFTKEALSANKPKEVWRIIHRILNQSQKPLRFDPNKLNDFFASTTERTLSNNIDTPQYLAEFVDNLPNDIEGLFKLREVSYGEVLRIIKTLRSDTSTGPDGIPVKFAKLVAEFISGPIAAIINNCIRTGYFPEAWKKARISPF